MQVSQAIASDHQSRPSKNSAFDRLLRQIPDDLRATFSPAQLAAVERGLRQAESRHRLDFRVSVPWFGRRYYIALLAGRESRSLDRLRREGQVTVGRIAATYGTLMFLVGGLMLSSAAVCIYSINKLMHMDDTASTESCLRTRS